MTEQKRPPLVILGLDVGDPEDIQRWVREGYLPTIGSIMENGCWGRIAGPEMLSEQGLWFSMFNGVSRGKHGYYYFRQLKPGTYDLEQFTGLNTTERPFWAYLNRTASTVAQIDVPDACPIPGLPGLQLMGWAIHNIHPPLPPYTEPAELIHEVRRLFGPQIILNERLKGDFAAEMRLYRRLLERIEKKGELCSQLLRQAQPDLFVTVFAETHTGAHQFWKHRPESPRAGGKENGLTYAIRDLYRAVDTQMGILLRQLPPDSNVFIVSASGMEDHYPAVGLIESFCRRLGYQATPPHASNAPLTPLSLARKLLPESLRIEIGRHLPRPVQDRLIAAQFRDGTDWRRTTAFPIPSHYNSFVRVNLRGREPQGIVAEGPELEALLKRIEDDLDQLVDPETGQSPVNLVFRSACYARGGKVHEALPELIVKWKPCQYLRRRLIHPKTELTQPIPGFNRDSEHSETAFVAAAGPSVPARGEIGDVSLLDLAPTFLAAIGQLQPERMEGRVIRAMVRE